MFSSPLSLSWVNRRASLCCHREAVEEGLLVPCQACLSIKQSGVGVKRIIPVFRVRAADTGLGIEDVWCLVSTGLVPEDWTRRLTRRRAVQALHRQSLLDFGCKRGGSTLIWRRGHCPARIDRRRPRGSARGCTGFSVSFAFCLFHVSGEIINGENPENTEIAEGELCRPGAGRISKIAR